MPLLNQEFSLTFRIGDDRFGQFAKVNISINGVDTSIPIEPQLEESGEALQKIWNFIYKKVYEEAERIIEEEK